MPKHHVVSIDFDGCYCAEIPVALSGFLEKNENFIDFLIKNTIKDYDGVTIMVGSNRQSLGLDGLNGTMKRFGSCYKPLHLLSEHLEVNFDGLLLSDIYLGKAPGETIKTFFATLEQLGLQDKILNLNDFSLLSENEILKPFYALSSRLFGDHDKINILYAQMHKLASDHPDAEIVFDFVDDQYVILEDIQQFFELYPALIPNTITLRLFQYGKDVFQPMAADAVTEEGALAADYGITGTGEIDGEYQETVKAMGEIAGEMQGNPRYKSGFHMAQCITPERLAKHCRPESPKAEAASSAVHKVPCSEHGFFAPTTTPTPCPEPSAADSALAARTESSSPNGSGVH